MKKIIPIAIIAIALAITGCSTKTTTPSNDQALADNEFANTAFSLNQPDKFIKENGIIKPKDSAAFNQIIYKVTKEDEMTPGQLQQWEKDNIEALCKDTDACGTIMFSENVTVSEVDGVKMTVQYKGRSIDDPKGYTYEYHYSFYKGTNQFRFWTSAADSEDLKAIESQFDEVINSIHFN